LHSRVKWRDLLQILSFITSFYTRKAIYSTPTGLSVTALQARTRGIRRLSTFLLIIQIPRRRVAEEIVLCTRASLKGKERCERAFDVESVTPASREAYNSKV
jgi:hypothetical protein